MSGTGKCANCGGALSDLLIGNVCLACFKRIVPRAFWPAEVREAERKAS